MYWINAAIEEEERLREVADRVTAVRPLPIAPIVVQVLYSTVAVVALHPAIAVVALHPAIAVVALHPAVAVVALHPAIAVVALHPALSMVEGYQMTSGVIYRRLPRIQKRMS